uniref:lipase family alpha/beta hydrolase n=1 Tax=Paractinoplanes polyasparticus TaxID=2856853 RepID=UPI001C859BEC|nr:lipase [Actinoplanes polyasparticus]
MNKTVQIFLIALALVLGVAGPAGAANSPYAPVHRPGPRLSVPVADLRAAVECSPDATSSRKPVALFVPATALDPGQFAWNWFPAFDRVGRPYCSVRLPAFALGDIQESAEYLVYAIRHVHRISGRRIAVVGHSQGGVDARFALRFWPDTRALVADYVAIGSPQHGSLGNDAGYPDGTPGPAALLQLRTNARLVQALNSRAETFPGISYTTIATEHDQFVTPISSAALRGSRRQVANVTVQDICPANATEHVGLGTADPVAYALTMDALSHEGPARPSRISRGVCSQTLMPGVDPATYERDFAATNEAIAANVTAARLVPREPALEPYVFDRCPPKA